MAVFIFCMFAAMYLRGVYSPSLKNTVYFFHKSTGVLLLFLVIGRLLWRFMNPQPSSQGTLLAKLDFLALYIFMLGMPLSGYFMSSLKGYDVPFYGVFTMPMLPHNLDGASFFWKTHIWMSYFMGAFIILHVIAALYHHFIRKDGIFKRMWSGQ